MALNSTPSVVQRSICPTKQPVPDLEVAFEFSKLAPAAPRCCRVPGESRLLVALPGEGSPSESLPNSSDENSARGDGTETETREVRLILVLAGFSW